MAYTLTLPCGCVVQVTGDRAANPTCTRTIAERGAHCLRRNHVVGVRVFLWEMLPDSARDHASARIERAIERP